MLTAIGIAAMWLGLGLALLVEMTPQSSPSASNQARDIAFVTLLVGLVVATGAQLWGLL